MNAAPRTDFSEEELVAFLCGAGSRETNGSIQTALDSEEELRAQLAFLKVLMPHARGHQSSTGPESDDRPKESLDTVRPDGVEETVTEQRTSPTNSDVDQLPDNLQAVADLSRQGLTPKQIGERMDVSKSLVEFKLHRIEKLRSKSRG